jgi:hypothetical protein
MEDGIIDVNETLAAINHRPTPKPDFSLVWKAAQLVERSNWFEGGIFGSITEKRLGLSMRMRIGQKACVVIPVRRRMIPSMGTEQ